MEKTCSLKKKNVPYIYLTTIECKIECTARTRKYIYNIRCVIKRFLFCFMKSRDNESVYHLGLLQMMMMTLGRVEMVILSVALLLSFAGIPPSLADPKPAPQSWLTSLFGGKKEIEATGENLFKAAQDGRLDDVKDLVERGVDANYADGYVMRVAAENGEYEIVKYLLDAGGNPNGTNETHSLGSVLEAAGKNNHVDIIDLLLEYGATVNTPKYGVGVMDRAAENGHLEAVQRLLDEGADPNYGGGYSLLLPAKHGHLDVVKAFIKAGADVNTGGGWILNNAAEEGHVEIVKTLIEAGASKDNMAYALARAAGAGQLEVVKLLIEKGADPNSDAEGQVPPLFSAALKGNHDVIAVLVENGADINQTLEKDLWWDVFTPYDAEYGNGWTVLHTASRFGFPIVQQLHNVGINIDAKDVKGRTALQVAVHYENPLVVKDLLRFCADSTNMDNEGTTALEMARDLTLMKISNNSAKYQDLKTIVKEVMSERLSSTPNNDKAISTVRKVFLSMMEANATLKAQVGENGGLDIYNAIYYILQDQGRAEMAGILEAHACQLLPSEGHNVIPLGSKHLIMCDCVPGQGPQLTFSSGDELNQCPSDSQAPE